MSRAGDDEEFEFERGLDAAPGGPKGAAVAGTAGKPNVSVNVPGGAAGGGGNQQLSSSLRVTDQHYDEAVDVHDESAASVVSPEHSPGGSAKPGGAAGAGPGSSKAADLKVDTSAKASQPAPPAIGASAKAGTPHVAPKAAATPSRGGASASTAAAAAAAAAAGSTAHHNKPGEVHDVDEAHAHAAAAQAAAAQAQGAAAAAGGGDVKEAGGAGGGGGMGGTLGAAPARPKPVLPLYNADEYRNLPGVTQEMQDLFDHISRYKPKHIELETKLKPFVPDFIPAVGDIDHFLKPPLPGADAKRDMLGLVSLDEPAAVQSDPTVLELLLRQSSRKADIKPMTVRSIEHAAANPKKITAWITNVAELMRKKPPPAVHYPKPMPDVEQLMQVWPQDFEDALKSMTLPGAELGMELRDYCRVVCAVLDIPVHDGRPIAESLHLLFTLFAEFKQNAAFAQAGGAAFPVAAAAAANAGAGGSNSLVISAGGDAKSDKKK